MTPATLTITARWVAPITSPPIESGAVRIVDGVIAEVGPARAMPRADLDLGDVVLLPAFVNAHTHLELSGLRHAVPFRGSFTQWIRDLRAVTPRERDEPGRRRATLAGIDESRRAGVLSVADIGWGQTSLDAWSDAGEGVRGYLELFGMGPRRESGWRSQVALREGASAGADLGLSPHAPYSVDAPVYRETLALARARGWPLTTHLAETREEAQFLRDGTGPFRELLESWGLWDGSFSPPGCSPVQYARQLGLLDVPTILAHVNDVDEDDIDRLARSRASVAYCPRTHAFFEHDPHSYRRMLDRGVNVCLGTDSLASTDTLSILDEIRFVRRRDAEINDARLIAMGTLNGARAMAREAEMGSIEPGKRADLVAVRLDANCDNKPLENLTRGAGVVEAVFQAGTPCRIEPV